MQAGVIRGGVCYRCHSKTLAPGSPVSAEHPKTVNLRELTLADPLNRWLAGLFSKQQRAQTLEFLLEAHNADDSNLRRNIVKARIADANQKLERYTRAIEAGIDPSSLVAAMNAAQAERAAAQVELNTIPRPVQVTARELSGIIDSHGDIRARLDAGDPMDKMELYKALEVQIRYQPIQRRAHVSAGLAVVSTGVRRGIRTLVLQQVCTHSVCMPPQYTFRLLLLPVFDAFGSEFAAAPGCGCPVTGLRLESIGSCTPMHAEIFVELSINSVPMTWVRSGGVVGVVLDHPGRDLRPGREAELGEDMFHMPSRRARRNHQPGADLLVGQTLGDQLGDLLLTFSQRHQQIVRPRGGRG
jgi:hypothetical protein